MTAYRRGADFERRVKAKLEADGWTVFRTAGSHSPADLIAIRPSCGPRVRLVQCKSGIGRMGPKARREFREFCEGLGAEAWVALRGMKLEAA